MSRIVRLVNEWLSNLRSDGNGSEDNRLANGMRGTAKRGRPRRVERECRPSYRQDRSPNTETASGGYPPPPGASGGYPAPHGAGGGYPSETSIPSVLPAESV